MKRWDGLRQDSNKLQDPPLKQQDQSLQQNHKMKNKILHFYMFPLNLEKNKQIISDKVSAIVLVFWTRNQCMKFQDNWILSLQKKVFIADSLRNIHVIECT